MSTGNTPQHIFDESDGPGTPGSESPEHRTRPTGPRTAPTNVDVADPHPADEDDYDKDPHPGGARPPTKDIGPNPDVHSGTAPARPHNAGSGAE